MGDARPYSVNSLWLNIERILAEKLPAPWPQIMLGVRGGFGVPRGAPAEYAWPGPSMPILLRRRSGIRVACRRGPRQDGLRRFLETDEPAVVAVDSFFLPYRPAYRRVHSGRTVLVRRDSERSGHLLVDDPWPPMWRGSLPFPALDAARWSEVVEERRREPVFAGVPLEGRWWSVEAPVGPPADISGWLTDRLADLAEDSAAASRSGCRAADGLVLMARRLGRAGGDPREDYRRASLLLRAELSPRAYMLSLVRVAARLGGDGWLAAEAEAYGDTLARLGEARDLLSKAAGMPRPEYRALIGRALKEGADGERALGQALAAYGRFGGREALRA